MSGIAASLSNSFSALKLGSGASSIRSPGPSPMEAQSPPLTFDVADTEPPEHPAYTVLNQHIDKVVDDMHKISNSIHTAAETCYRERRTAEIVGDYLDKQTGWKVVRGPYNLPTCVEGVFEHRRGGRSMCFIAEMDCLPGGLGHANGHNLAAACAIGAGCALARTLVEHDIAGRVVILATPASGAGGKITLLRAGAFKGLDAIFALQPGPYDGHAHQLALAQCEVEYLGTPAHTATPWNGVNALDAAVLAYTNVSALRQQLPPDVRVSGLIGPSSEWRQGMVASDGGGSSTPSPPTRGSPGGRTTTLPIANTFHIGTMPSHAQLFYAVRCGNLSSLQPLQRKIAACFDGAATATGTEVTTRWTLVYFDLRVNSALAADYNRVMRDVQGVPQHVNLRPLQSTDLGNVSYEYPVIQPVINIGGSDGGGLEQPANHTRAFTRLARSREAHEKMVKATRGVTTTALRMLLDYAFFAEVKAAQETDKRNRAKAAETKRVSWTAEPV